MCSPSSFSSCPSTFCVTNVNLDLLGGFPCHLLIEAFANNPHLNRLLDPCSHFSLDNRLFQGFSPHGKHNLQLYICSNSIHYLFQTDMLRAPCHLFTTAEAQALARADYAEFQVKSEMKRWSARWWLFSAIKRCVLTPPKPTAKARGK